mmetsp:Transcript_10863/g.18170  ORF Transcript_10863/g.18170 Transcript_10863/m.18170 type:complete len:309 (+) Transcript_10863:400-1326(+)
MHRLQIDVCEIGGEFALTHGLVGTFVCDGIFTSQFQLQAECVFARQREQFAHLGQFGVIVDDEQRHAGQDRLEERERRAKLALCRRFVRLFQCVDLRAQLYAELRATEATARLGGGCVVDGAQRRRHERWRRRHAGQGGVRCNPEARGTGTHRLERHGTDLRVQQRRARVPRARSAVLGSEVREARPLLIARRTGGRRHPVRLGLRAFARRCATVELDVVETFETVEIVVGPAAITASACRRTTAERVTVVDGVNAPATFGQRVAVVHTAGAEIVVAQLVVAELRTAPRVRSGVEVGIVAGASSRRKL